MNKRGISAIIATVILIAFVIIIGGIVWIYIQRFSSEQLEDIGDDEACFDLNINIVEACYTIINPGDDTIRIKVESESTQEVDSGFLVRIFGGSEMLAPSEPFTKLKGFNVVDIEVPYDSSKIGTVDKVEVIPKVRREDGSQIVCSLQSDTFNVIGC